ncbi:ABC-type transport system protein [Candidatus Terasakiella magnetica]|nr:ABC-type transport system protein [Candidatus Terasakiella magnetica]
MRSRLLASIVMGFLVLGLPGMSHAAEHPAEAVIRHLCDTLIEMMKAGDKLGFKGRVEKLKPLIPAVYDMPSMTQSTLGTAIAAKLTQDETAKLIDLYTRFSVATYASQFNDWDGERFEIDEPRPSTAGAIILPSRIVPKTGEPTEIHYVMRQEQGHWKVVDVLFEGTISQVAVRRSEFVSIFRSKQFSGLMEALEKQTASLEK